MSEPREIDILLDAGAHTTAFIYPAHKWPKGPGATFILAHGAGAGQRHPFITAFGHGLSERGVDVVTFNFLYMEQRRRMPDRMPQLVACYRAVITHAREHLESARERLFIGGKSMGGRAATHVAADHPEVAVNGIILLGYPLHPPGRLDKMRDAHLPAVKRPMLFVQGSRDAFGTPAELKPVLAKLPAAHTLHEVQGEGHSYKVNDQIQNILVDWIDSIP
jgi:predicted alpha/beta-hydrolase family hydrolase